jgi:hypothetical protein
MNKIRFYPFNESTAEFAPAPIPASKQLPEWYRKQPGIIKSDLALQNGVVNSTVKKCMPVFDILSAGYLIVAPCDIHVDATDPEKLSYSIPLAIKQFQSDVFATHAPEQYDHYPIDTSRYHKQLLRIMPFWSVATSAGYSTMFSQPFHREDTELFALSAIVDTDKFITEGHLSFLVKKGFKGIIKQGTPLIQLIPFKREDWESEEVSVEESSKTIFSQRLKLRSTFANGYKDKFRSKKEYK